VSTGSQYVVAVYAVIWFVLLLYVVVLGARTARVAREVELLARLVERRRGAPDEDDRPVAASSAPGPGERSGLR
jgi:CcmD family protein